MLRLLIAVFVATAASLARGQNSPVPVAEAAAKMTVPDGFHVSLFAGEPDVVQPIATCFDDRGRLWVVENFSYPNWSTDGKPGHDRVIIFDDPDGTGHFKTRKVFLDNGSNLSGIEFGFGGVWLCSTPNLIFIPLDASGDKPAGPARVILDGWSLNAKHNVFNRLTWGPDGWLYGCNGILDTSHVGKPGAPQDARTPLNCGVWRYHPTRDQFEVFAWGTTNPWGLDFDDRGQMFITNCVIKHLFHVVQGAHFQRMYGQDLNPNAYALIESCADHIHWAGGDWTSSRTGVANGLAGGGHAHSGAMVYLGDNWPDSYRNSIFMCNIHGSRVNNDMLERQGSGYVAHHGKDFLLANDPWFRGLDLHYGPDGGVYVMDWTDTGECHNYLAVDQTTGRIYKVVYGDKPLAKLADLDLQKSSDDQLVRYQSHKNEWFARHARRILQERKSAGKLGGNVVPQLTRMLADDPDVSHKLRALWTLHATGGLDRAALLQLLDHPDPYIRAWTIQLALENRQPDLQFQASLTQLAASDASPVVRLYLASAMQRMADGERWPIGLALAGHAEDANDPNLPLMIWYGMEPSAGTDAKRAVEAIQGSKMSVVRQFSARRITTLAGGSDRLTALLAGNQDVAVRRDVLRGMNEALSDQREFAAPLAWAKVGPSLMESADAEIRESATSLSALFGDPKAMESLRGKLLSDADPAARQRALQVLVQHRDPKLPELLAKLLADPNMAGPALRALASTPGEQTSRMIIEHYPQLTKAQCVDAINTLASRPEWATAMLDAVDDGKIPRGDVSTVVIRQLLTFQNPQVNDKLAKVWGRARLAAEDKRGLIARYKANYPLDRLVNADLSNGRAVFTKTCAQCHILFDSGGQVGPNLTGSQRANLDYLFENILDPSAVVAREYLMTIVQTKNGRVINGIIQKETPASLTLRTPTEDVVLQKDEIEKRVTSNQSMMPEGLLEGLAENDVRDLIAYLRSDQQAPLAEKK